MKMLLSRVDRNICDSLAWYASSILDTILRLANERTSHLHVCRNPTLFSLLFVTSPGSTYHVRESEHTTLRNATNWCEEPQGRTRA